MSLPERQVDEVAQVFAHLEVLQVEKTDTLFFHVILIIITRVTLT